MSGQSPKKSWIRSVLTMLPGLSLPERIVLYVVASMLIIKIFLELILGTWFYVIEPPRQYFFFTFLFIEYVILMFNQRRDLKIRGFALLVIALTSIMIIQGVVVGFYNNNDLFDIFNDTVPMLCIPLTVILFENDVSRKRRGSMRTFAWIVGLAAMAIFVIGCLALALHRPSIASIGGGPTQGVVFCTLLAAIASGLDRRLAPLFVLIIMISIPNMNRTTLLFSVMIGMGFGLSMFIRSPVKLFGVLALVVFAGWITIANLPPNSRLVQRLQATENYNPAQRTGAIGERQAEADAVNYKLKSLGHLDQIFGMGHGALYSFQSTQKYVQNSGHAHYGWALFNLRYGEVGYFYLFCFVCLLFYSFVRNVSIGGMEGYFHGSLALLGLLFVPTWFTFNLMIAGIQLLIARPNTYVDEEAPQEEALTGRTMGGLSA